MGAALQGLTLCGGLHRPHAPAKAVAGPRPWALYPSFEKGFAGKWAAPPQHCQKGASLFSASSANLAKDAYRGRHGTACPAMPPLRFLQGLTPPLHPAVAGPHPKSPAAKACQCSRFTRGLVHFHESHHLARCSARAHLRAPSACAGMQTRCVSSVLRCAL